MKSVAWIVILIVIPGFVFSAERIETLEWNADLQQPGLRVQDGVLEVYFDGPRESSHWMITDPAITTTRWAIQGRVKTKLETGSGYLEMMSWFPDGSHHFSRTLAESGPMATLQGTSEWREFALPFFSEEGMPPPNMIGLKLVVDGKGTVSLGGISLWSFDGDEDPTLPRRAWWDWRTASIIGSVGGVGFGLMGAVIGILVSRGRGRHLTIGLLCLMLSFGAVALAAGGLAFATDQPRPVWYPLALLGLIGTAVGGAALPNCVKRYRELEERRIRALDL